MWSESTVACSHSGATSPYTSPRVLRALPYRGDVREQQDHAQRRGVVDRTHLVVGDDRPFFNLCAVVER
jgi:hypothetical protein